MSEQTDKAIIDGLISQARESTERLTETRHCFGTYALADNTGGIAYRKTGTDFEAGWLDFTSPNLGEAELKGLVSACDAATFGRGDENVLDPSYRKAWKLDTSRFAAQFDVVQSGLLDTVHDALLRFNDSSLKINAQLYKLNVYGPGSHFKSHLDTPRSDKMFGSLVIIFPTEHVGGDLVLRFKDTAWNFESSKMLSKTGDSDLSAASPHLAWVAFFSDIEHEVALVESGYRVSLTYNLYYSEDTPNRILPSIAPHLVEEENLRTALENLLASPLVLPEGGALGFGLTFQYPISKTTKDNRSGSTSFSTVVDTLKGTDALVKRVCNGLGLECHVKALYDLNGDDGDYYDDPLVGKYVYLTDRAYPDGDFEESVGEGMDCSPNLRVVDAFAGEKALEPIHSEKRPRWVGEDAQLATVVRVLWVTQANKLTELQTAVSTHGNEPGVGFFYAYLVLVAMVPSYQARSTAATVDVAAQAV